MIIQDALNIEILRYTWRASLVLPYVYLSNAKAACSTIQTTLLKTEYELGLREHYPIEGRNSDGTRYFTNELDSITELDGCFKFSSIRNPYVRALSTYLDKIVGKRDEVYKQYYKSFPEAPKDLSFFEYLENLKEMHPALMDPHWRPQVYNIAYGHIPLQCLCAVENLSSSFLEVCQQLFNGKESLVSVEWHATQAISRVKEFYGTREIEAVAKLYSVDFDSFGYTTNIDDVAKPPQELCIFNYSGLNAKRLAKAIDLEAHAQYEQAIELLLRIHQDLPQNPFILETIASCHWNLNHIDLAIDFIDHAIELEKRIARFKSIRNRILRASSKPVDRSSWRSLFKKH